MTNYISTILCECGQTISLLDIPNENIYKFVSEDKFNKHSEMIDIEDPDSNTEEFIKCKKCGRLWFLGNEYDQKPRGYIPS
jgi:hypothetical protein